MPGSLKKFDFQKINLYFNVYKKLKIFVTTLTLPVMPSSITHVKILNFLTFVKEAEAEAEVQFSVISRFMSIFTPLIKPIFEKPKCKKFKTIKLF